MIMLAQTDLIPGWFTLLLQGGSFAVIVYLIVWGRKELAIERKAELDAFVAEAKEQRKDFKGSLDAVTTTFKLEAAAERAACEKHFTTLAETMGHGNDATIQAIKTMAEQVQQHALRNQQWSELLRAEIAKREAKGGNP